MKQVIDVHAHILPGVDDGAVDWEESRQMLTCAYGQGIRTIIATPHYSHRQDVERLRELAGQMESEAKKISLDFKIFLGQEILYFDGIVEHLQKGQVLTMADSRYVLVEFMPDVSYKKMYQGVRNVLIAGYYPIIAHVERYAAMHKEDQMQELARTGCFMQMNYKSLQGGILDRRVRWCRRQVEEQRIHFLATDMHHRNHRTPEISKNLRWLSDTLDENQYASITEKNPQKILSGEFYDGNKKQK